MERGKGRKRGQIYFFAQGEDTHSPEGVAERKKPRPLKSGVICQESMGLGMEAINLKAEADKIIEFFEYKTIAKMNGHVFTLIKAKDRTLDFHTHTDSDEVFYIVEGEMKIEFRDRMVHLNTGEMCVVPKGMAHRPVCETEVTAMLIEIDGTLTPDNTGGTYKNGN